MIDGWQYLGLLMKSAIGRNLIYLRGFMAESYLSQISKISHSLILLKPIV
jgi:hypothetical protein